MQPHSHGGVIGPHDVIPERAMTDVKLKRNLPRVRWRRKGIVLVEGVSRDLAKLRLSSESVVASHDEASDLIVMEEIAPESDVIGKT